MARYADRKTTLYAGRNLSGYAETVENPPPPLGREKERAGRGVRPASLAQTFVTIHPCKRAQMPL